MEHVAYTAADAGSGVVAMVTVHVHTQFVATCVQLQLSP